VGVSDILRFPSLSVHRSLLVMGSAGSLSILVFVACRVARVFFFSSRRRHTRSVSAFLLNRSSDLLLQRIFLMSSLMLLLVWLIFFMVLIKLLPILGTISGKTVKLMVLALICLGNNRQD